MRNTSPEPNTAPSGHPIRVVAERTGLSPNVIRVWELRYSADEPTRSPGGQRPYSNAQIARFRLLTAATRHGRNISMVAGLSTEALERLVAEDDAEPSAPAHSIERPARAEPAEVALEHTRSLDGTALERELRRTIARQGIPAFLEEAVPALMHRVGAEWREERLTIAHEHRRDALAAHIPVVLGGSAAMRMADRLMAPGLVVCGSLAEMRRVLPRDTAIA